MRYICTKCVNDIVYACLYPASHITIDGKVVQYPSYPLPICEALINGSEVFVNTRRMSLAHTIYRNVALCAGCLVEEINYPSNLMSQS